MNIPKEVLLRVADESPSFRLYLVEVLLNPPYVGPTAINAPYSDDDYVNERHFRTAFMRKLVNEGKIAAIKQVRNSTGQEQADFLRWSKECQNTLASEGGWDLAESKKFVDELAQFEFRYK